MDRRRNAAGGGPNIISEETETILRRNAAWAAGQKEAFQAAMDGAPLETSLGILIRTVMEQTDGDRRCAFYIANAEGTALDHVTGMPEDYARHVANFRIGPDSLACGLAASTGQPVMTRDVAEEPRWAPWLWLARDFDYRGCWSFPVETSTGRIVGTFAMYFREPRAPSPRDLELVETLTHSASIIISRHQESEARAWIAQSLVRSESSLAAELAAARELQSLSTELVHEQDIERLYQRIVDAAAMIMRSDHASMQVLYPERGAAGELRLLASRGLNTRARAHWAWVTPGSTCASGAAFRARERVIVPDIATWDLVAGTEDEKLLGELGICAVQSTPLISRSGRLVGMLSTHWHEPHAPSEIDLQLCDVLARQAADLLERAEAEAAVRLNERQLRAYLTASVDVVYRMSPDWSVMRHLDGKAFIADTDEPNSRWLDKYIHPDDQAVVLNAINHAIQTKSVFELEHRVLRVDGRPGWTLSRAIPLFDDNGEIVEWIGTATDVTARKQQEERQRLLLNELNHRVKNTLATVQSMAAQTLRNSQDTEQARVLFGARLIALSKAHDILTRENWEGALLGQVIDEAIGAHRDLAHDRFEVEGPAVWLSAKQALALSIALHELCTNAVKYGALSNDTGRIRIAWSVAGLNGARKLAMRWTELDGPSVARPSRSGFGLRLIERGLHQDLNGEVTIDFATTGVVCTIDAPLHPDQVEAAA